MFAKIIDIFIWIYTNTIAKLNVPYNHKKFNLNDYFKIEKELDKLVVPFAIGLVTTYGSGSNMGIKFSNWLSKDKLVKKSKKTHLFIFINQRDGYKFRVAEQVGTGLHETSLLKAIGQKDEVTIRIPNKRAISDTTSSIALDYIHGLLDIDNIKNIPYDLVHELEINDSSDCSGLLWQALTYAFESQDMNTRVETFKRGGIETFLPADAEYSNLFQTLYSSKIGFFK